VVGGLARAVRDAAAEVGCEAHLELTGMETPLDRSILDGIGDALVHLVRNAVFHGIEPADERAARGKPRVGTIRIDAEQRGGLVALACVDDGRGVSEELLARVAPGGSLADLLAEPGFSTAGGVSGLAGRGVGLDAVRHHVEGVGGTLEVSSEPGAGTAVTLLVPLTLAVVTVLLFERGRRVFGVPLSGVDRAVRGGGAHQLHGRRALELDGVTVPLGDLADSLGMDAPALHDDCPVVIVVSGTRRAAVECDRLLGDREVVVKSLGPLLESATGYLGAAILDDGAIALLLDPAHLVRTTARAPQARRSADRAHPRAAPKILVVEDQFTVRELERTILEAAGYRVRTAEDGRAALAVLDREPDIECVVSDVEMPRMDGLELLEAIRARPERSALPVIIVSASDDDEVLARGADAGADAWVVKSEFEQDALLETVGRLIGPR
jgi:two-component system chemotaxis sensor kinase CheA